jgi:AraC-like DNA-binding protein
MLERSGPAVVPIGSPIGARRFGPHLNQQCTDHHFTRKFEQQVGLRPKTMARLARFAYSLELMRGTSNDSSLGRVAARAGYCDQAHFNREFREFAECTPRQHLAESDGDPDVQFVQDDQQVSAVASSS